MFRHAVLAGAAALITACTTPSQPAGSGVVSPGIQVSSGREFDLGVGQEAHVQGTTISVRLVRVSEDSRCPVDVTCVWAGNALAHLAVSTAGAGGTAVILNTTLEPRSTGISGYRIRLGGLKPAPRSGSTIPPGDYVATLEVTPL